jgi:class 3 adenylate cyclase/tetratricopeptide (TPR) repeat protein
MHCPVCGHENQPDSKFCAQCGTELTVTCAVCATPSPAGAKFCNNCGADLAAPVAHEDDALERLIPPEMLNKLRSARAGRAMAGERRTVTMLFADIKGSTSAAEQLDPEDWAEVMNVTFPRLIEPIYRYEGTLAQLLGDAVLAFFGAPIAHDDDPIRAVRAGLDIVDGMAECRSTILERYGVPIEVRVGINTGLVVVGEVGSDLRVEYTALGDAINVAARMEQTAEPGTVQVSERTLTLTHGAFEAVDLGPVDVKGKSEPIRTFRPTAFLGTAGEVFAHRFVGRDEEVGKVLELVDHLAAGSGWVASVIGEAGLGKSALLRECERRADSAMAIARHPEDDGVIAAMTGASQSYDASRPMSGFRDVLDRWFALDGIDDYARIQAATSDVEFPDVTPLIAHAAGAALPPEDRAFIDALAPPVLLQRVRAATSAYVSAEAQRRPLIIVFEDLHWSDDLTIDLISDLLATTDTAPVGILFSMRPYRDDPSWRVHEKAARDHSHRYHEVQLSPLGEAAAVALITDMLGDLDEHSVEAIIKRSAGNPLFLEEIANSLGEGGTIGGVPDSLAGVLAARLDRLDEQSRLVAQVSSVLGTEFRRDTVSALVDGVDVADTITDLLRQGIFIESRSAPGRLQFRHALLQDAAYSSVLLRTRRTLHAEVAVHLVEVAPEGAPEIARHFVAAGDYDRAFPFLVEAGTQATRAMALADAIRDFREAIDNAPEDADDHLVQQAHLGLGEAYALLPDLSESAAAFQRLFEYGERTERPAAQVAALNQLGFTTATAGGDTVAANKYLRQARALAEEIGDERGLIEYHMNACMVAAFDGDPLTAVDHDEQTMVLGAAIGDDRIRVEGLRRRAMNQALVLDLEQAEVSMTLATAAANQLGSAQAVAELEVLGRGIIETARGRYREAIAVVEPQLAILERFASFDLPMSHGLIARIRWELGEPGAALASFIDTRRTGRGFGQPFSEAVGTAGMAAAYAAFGDRAEAQSLLDETRIGEGPMGDYFASTSWYYVGLTHLLTGEPAAAVDAFTRGIAAPAVVQYIDRRRLLVGLTLALIGIGEVDRAGTILDEAREFVIQKHLDPSDPELTLADGVLRAATGDTDEARRLLTETATAADARDHRWVAFQAAWALADLTGSFDDARDRTEDMASGIADPDLAASFRTRWLDRATSTT